MGYPPNNPGVEKSKERRKSDARDFINNPTLDNMIEGLGIFRGLYNENAPTKYAEALGIAIQGARPSDIPEDIFNQDALNELSASIFDMEDATGKDILGAYNLYEYLKVDEGIKNYESKVASDPTTNANLQPFVTSSDAGIFEKGGILEGEEDKYRRIQADKNELIVLPDMSIVEPAAKKGHKGMDKKKVTEVLPVGSFIASDDVYLFAKDFKDILISSTTEEYKEGEKAPEPVEVYFEDIFSGKKKRSVKELVEEVQKMYPTTNREDDAITYKSNEANKASRQQWLNIIIDAATAKGGKNKEPLVKSEDPEQFLLGGILAAVGGVIGIGTGIYNWFSADSNADKARDILKKSSDKQRGLLRQSVGLGMMGALAQDTRVTKRDFSAELASLESLVDKVPTQVRENALRDIDTSTRVMSEQVFKGTTSFDRAVDVLSSLHARSLQAKGALSRDFTMQDIQLSNAKTQAKTQKFGEISATKAAESNQERANRNAQIMNLVTPAVQGLGQEAQLEANIGAQEIAIQGAEAAGKQAAIQAGAQNALSFASAGLSLGSSITNPSTLTQTTNTNIDPFGYTGTKGDMGFMQNYGMTMGSFMYPNTPQGQGIQPYHFGYPQQPFSLQYYLQPLSD